MHIRGVDLAIQQTGAGHRMLWCHGLTSSMAREDDRDLFGFATLRSTTAGIELVRYDARGHGRTGGSADPADYRWDRLAEDANAVLHAIDEHEHQHRPWIVGGASMGAATTLHLAVAHPETVRAMVLVIPPTAWETRAVQRDLYERGAAFVRAKGTSAFVAASRALPPLPLFADEPDQGRFEPDIAEDLFATVLEGAASADLPTPSEVADIVAPTLILSWAGDPGHPVSTGERLAALLPRSTFHVADTLGEVRTWGATIAAFTASLDGPDGQAG